MYALTDQIQQIKQIKSNIKNRSNPTDKTDKTRGSINTVDFGVSKQFLIYMYH